MAIMDEQIKRDKPASILGPTLSRRGFIKTGGILVVGFSFAGPELLKGDTAKPSSIQELARSHSSQFLDRDPSGQHSPDSHRQERFRTGLNLYRLSPNRRRRVERSLRSHHHRHRGRYRSHSRRQWRLRFPRTRNAQHPQGRRLHLSSDARSRLRKTRRSERQAYGQGRHILRRRQVQLVWRPRQGPATETHDPRHGRSHQHLRTDHRGQSADEASQRVHASSASRSRIPSSLRKSGKRNLGHRCPPARHVAWARGASEDAGLDARLCRLNSIRRNSRIRKSS